MPARGAVQAVPSALAGQWQRPGRHRSRAIGVRANPPGPPASDRPVRSSGPVTAYSYRAGGLLAATVGADHRFGACPERCRRLSDMQGHVRQVTDIDGDVVAEHAYDAWGLIALPAAAAMAFGDWGYTWDGKPGRYYVQQRHLRADLGRWMSIDPLETEPPYAYVGDRPTWAVDPNGEQRIGIDPRSPGSMYGPAYVSSVPEFLVDVKAPVRPVRWGPPSVAEMSLGERIAEAIRRSERHLGPTAWKAVKRLASAESVAAIAATLSVWAAAHFFGIGEIIDAVLLVAGTIVLGMDAVNGAVEIYRFASAILHAPTDADLESAAKHFANAVVILSVTAVFAVLLRRSARGRPGQVGTGKVRRPPNGLATERPATTAGQAAVEQRRPVSGSRGVVAAGTPPGLHPGEPLPDGLTIVVRLGRSSSKSLKLRGPDGQPIGTVVGPNSR